MILLRYCDPTVRYYFVWDNTDLLTLFRQDSEEQDYRMFWAAFWRGMMQALWTVKLCQLSRWVFGSNSDVLIDEEEKKWKETAENEIRRRRENVWNCHEAGSWECQKTNKSWTFGKSLEMGWGAVDKEEQRWTCWRNWLNHEILDLLTSVYLSSLDVTLVVCDRRVYIYKQLIHFPITKCLRCRPWSSLDKNYEA